VSNKDIEEAFEHWKKEVEDRNGLDALSDKDNEALDKVGRMVALLDASTFRLLEASKKQGKRDQTLSEMRGLRNEVRANAEDIRIDLSEFKEWWDGQLGRVQDLIVLLTSLDMGLEDEHT